jgi:hypothetical protein
MFLLYKIKSALSVPIGIRFVVLKFLESNDFILWLVK